MISEITDAVLTIDVTNNTLVQQNHLLDTWLLLANSGDLTVAPASKQKYDKLKMLTEIVLSGELEERVEVKIPTLYPNMGNE